MLLLRSVDVQARPNTIMRIDVGHKKVTSPSPPIKIDSLNHTDEKLFDLE